MIEIEILDTGKRLPLSKKERLRMTFQAADFGEAGSGSGSFSTTCSVPITPQVIEALGFSIVPNATSILSAYKNIKARILQDENEIDKGFIRIDEENTTKKELKITFYGRNVDWFTALGDRTLKDLSLLQYDHAKTNLSINEVRTEGYVYLPVDYGTLQAKSSAEITDEEIWPACFVNTIVKQIFKEVGFKVSGTLFSKPDFNRLLIPFSQEEINMTGSYKAYIGISIHKKPKVNSADWQYLPAFNASAEIKLIFDANKPYKGNVSYNSDTKNAYNDFLESYGRNNPIAYRDSRIYIRDNPELNNVPNRIAIKDDLNTYDTINNIYTSPTAMDVDVYIRVGGLRFILGSGGGGSNIFSYAIIIKKNGTEIYRKNLQQLGNGLLKVGQSFDSPYTTIVRNITGLQKDDTLEFYIQVNTFYDSAYYGDGYLDSPKMQLVILPQNTALVNYVVSLPFFLPNMKQSNLMEYLFFVYGIVPSFDKNTNTVILDSLTDLTVNSAENWTGKLDTSQNIERRYFDFVENYAKQNNCIYAELEDDTEIQTYANNYLSGYGSGAITIDNDYLDAEQNYFEAPFFPTKQRKVFTGISNLNFQLPYIFKTDSDEGRIVLFAGYRSVSELSNTGISTVTIAGESRTTIPYSYFIPPLNIQINDPINLVNLGFNNPLDEFQASLPILQRTYYNLTKVLNKPISITCCQQKTAYDISRLKFNRLKYIQELGGYFYLNKISQYDGSGEPTECELIKWY